MAKLNKNEETDSRGGWIYFMRLAHLPSKQKVPGSNPDAAGWRFSNMACKV